MLGLRWSSPSAELQRWSLNVEGGGERSGGEVPCWADDVTLGEQTCGTTEEEAESALETACCYLTHFNNRKLVGSKPGQTGLEPGTLSYFQSEEMD